jgi:hypothetical protein
MPRGEYYDLVLKFAKTYSEGLQFEKANRLQQMVCNDLGSMDWESGQQPANFEIRDWHLTLLRAKRELATTKANLGPKGESEAMELRKKIVGRYRCMLKEEDPTYNATPNFGEPYADTLMTELACFQNVSCGQLRQIGDHPSRCL